jgi:hypothetical protein
MKKKKKASDPMYCIERDAGTTTSTTSNSIDAYALAQRSSSSSSAEERRIDPLIGTPMVG